MVQNRHHDSAEGQGQKDQEGGAFEKGFLGPRPDLRTRLVMKGQRSDELLDRHTFKGTRF